MLIAVGYLYIMNSPRKVLHLLRMRRLLLWLLILCIALYVYEALPEHTLPFAPDVFQSHAWMNEFAFALCYGYLVTAVLFNRADRWLVRFFSWTPLRWLGLISFSLYIWHRPLIQILAVNLGPSLKRFNPVLTMILFWLIAFTVIVVFCYFLFVLIEKPGMRLSERIRQQFRRQDAERRVVSEAVHTHSESQMDTVVR
jgi:peptidoglycan/LPS O-acetylase OafA/YrhL